MTEGERATVVVKVDSETWRWVVKMASNNEMSVSDFASFLIDQGRSNVREAAVEAGAQNFGRTSYEVHVDAWRTMYQSSTEQHQEPG